MKGTVAALAAAVLVAVVLATGAAPVQRDTVRGLGASGTILVEARAAGMETHVLWGGLLDLPENGTLLVRGVRFPYGPDEVLEVRAFLERGGHLLVADSSTAAASLVRGLDVGLDVTVHELFDPDRDEAGRFSVTGTGALGVEGAMRVAFAHVVLGDGDAVAVSGPFTWQDLDADGVPDLGEPRGSWSVARVRDVGRGAILVLGAPELAVTEPASQQIRTWVQAQPPLLVDGYHRTGGDPLDAAPLLAGHRSAAVASLLTVVALMGAAIAWSLRAIRTRRKRRRRRADVETLEILAELEA